MHPKSIAAGELCLKTNFYILVEFLCFYGYVLVDFFTVAAEKCLAFEGFLHGRPSALLSVTDSKMIDTVVIEKTTQVQKLNRSPCLPIRKNNNDLL